MATFLARFQVVFCFLEQYQFTSRTWEYFLKSLQERLAIARDTLGIADDNLQIAGWRRQAGLVSSLDSEQARAARAQALRRRKGAADWLAEALVEDTLERIEFLSLEPCRALVMGTGGAELGRLLER